MSSNVRESLWREDWFEALLVLLLYTIVSDKLISPVWDFARRIYTDYETKTHREALYQSSPLSPPGQDGNVYGYRCWKSRVVTQNSTCRAPTKQKNSSDCCVLDN